jgi:uncharacterized membrane protein
MNRMRTRGNGFRDLNVGSSVSGALGVQEHTYPPNRQDFPGDSARMRGSERMVSAAAGGVLLWYGLTSHSVTRWLLTLSGAGLLYQGATGQSLLAQVPVIQDLRPVQSDLRIKKSLTVNRPVEAVYSFWRNLENLPRFMEHVRSVEQLDDVRSHWVVALARGMEFEWDAQILVDRPNEMIAWETLPGAVIYNRGSVKFVQAPGRRGTEVHVSLEYSPPGMIAGRIAASMLNFIPAQRIKEEIRNFKHILEAGEIPTVFGQPAARSSAWREVAQREEMR